jgi:imidazolonepropionase-like amidohydrolase
VHVGEIVAVGKDVKAGGQKVDSTGMIVMPRIIDVPVKD